MMLLRSTLRCFTAASVKRIEKEQAHKKQGIFHPSKASSDAAVIQHAPRAERSHHPHSITRLSCKQKEPETDVVLRVLHKYNISHFIKA